MPFNKDEHDAPREGENNGRFTEQEEKAAPGRLGKYLAGRLINKPSIGESRGRRRGRRGFDVDIPTGGKPGTRRPTGSRRDPDNDGWADEGTTNPVWVGIDAEVNQGSLNNEKPRSSDADSPKASRQSLASGGGNEPVKSFVTRGTYGFDSIDPTGNYEPIGLLSQANKKFREYTSRSLSNLNSEKDLDKYPDEARRALADVFGPEITTWQEAAAEQNRLIDLKNKDRDAYREQVLNPLAIKNSGFLVERISKNGKQTQNIRVEIYDEELAFNALSELALELDARISNAIDRGQRGSIQQQINAVKKIRDFLDFRNFKYDSESRRYVRRLSSGGPPSADIEAFKKRWDEIWSTKSPDKSRFNKRTIAGEKFINKDLFGIGDDAPDTDAQFLARDGYGIEATPTSGPRSAFDPSGKWIADAMTNAEAVYEIQQHRLRSTEQTSAQRQGLPRESANQDGAPLLSGGTYRERELAKTAEALGVDISNFFDSSTDEDDISESTSDWSLAKVGKQRAGDAIIVRTNRNGEKEVLTITRERGPFRGAVALPGGLFDETLDEDIQSVAGREMMEEVNIDPDSAMSSLQLGIIDSPIWDPRFVDGAEVAATRFDVDMDTSLRAQAGDDASKFEWINLNDLSMGVYPIAFGHAEWLARAFGDDEELSARFDVLSEASTMRNARLIRAINDVRRGRGEKLFKESDIRTSRLSSGRKIPLSDVTRENVVSKLEELTGQPATDKQLEVLDDTLSQAMLDIRQAIGSEQKFSSAFELTGPELIDALAIEVSRDGIPFVSGKPIPQLAEQIPDKRDWREVELPTRSQVNEILEQAKDELAHYYEEAQTPTTPEQRTWVTRKGEVIARGVEEGEKWSLVYENSDMENRFPLLQLFAPEGKPRQGYILDYRGLNLDFKAEEEGTYDEASSYLPPLYFKAWKKHSEFLRELARRAGLLMGDESFFSPENERVNRPGVVDGTYLLTYIAGLSNPLFFNMGLGGRAGQSYHDLFGHLGTGRSFDRHGEWANDLAMFSIVDHPDSPLSEPEKEAVKQLHFLMYSAARVGTGRLDDGIQPGLTDPRRVARRFGGNLESTLSDEERKLTPSPNENPGSVWFAGKISNTIKRLDEASASNRLSSGRTPINLANNDDLSLAVAQDILGLINKRELLAGEKQDYDVLDSMRLASGDSPRFPREPAYGPLLGGAEDVFKNIDSWEQFKERYDNTEIVFLDYETTGLNSDEFGELIDRGKPVQIGAVRIKNGQVVERFNVFVNPEEPLREWSARNLKNADGLPLTDEYLSLQMSIEDAHRQLADFIGPNAIVGVQYAPFDKNVLEDSLLQSGIDWRPRGYIDTNSFADLTLPKWTPESPDGPVSVKPDGTIYPSTSLKAITEYLGVELGDKHHSADADALAAAQVMQGIIDNAIKKSFSTNALSKTKRDRILALKRGEWIDSVEDFRAAKMEFLSPSDAEAERLSSGVRERLGIVTRKPPRKARTVPGKKYKYGDKDEFGKEIRKTSNTWLKGLTSEQIADVLVPSSEDEMIEMWADDFLPGWKKSGEAKNFIAYFREQLDKYPVMRADFSPESIEATRNLISQTLNSNRQLKWMFENFGAPNFFMSTKEGMDWYHNQPDVSEAMERLRISRGAEKAPYAMGMALTSIDAITFNRRALIDRESSTDGQPLELFMSETDEVIPGDTHISKALSGILVHEYGHWLVNRAAEDGTLSDKERGRSYYGSGNLNDPRYAKAMQVFEQYLDSEPNEELIGLFESGVPMDMTPDKPRLTTSYGHTTMAEAFAEGFVAVMHPNRDVQMQHINKKLRDDVYAIMGGDENFKPWDEVPERAAPGRPAEARNSRRARILSALRQLTGVDRLSSGASTESELERITSREDARQRIKESLSKLPPQRESESPGRRRLSQLMEEDAISLSGAKPDTSPGSHEVVSGLKRSVAESISAILPYSTSELAEILNEALEDSDIQHAGTFDKPAWAVVGGLPAHNTREVKRILDRRNKGQEVSFFIDKLGQVWEKNIPSIRRYEAESRRLEGAKVVEELSTETEEGMSALRSALLSDVVHSWAISANNQNLEMMTIQHEARNLFGLDESLGWSYDKQQTQDADGIESFVSENPDTALRRLANDSAPKRSPRYNALIRDVLLAMYERTQEYYRSRGITHIPVWRGYTGPYSTEIADNGAAIVPARLRPLSSWSLDPGTALSFAEVFGGETSVKPSGPEDRVGMVVMAYVPVEDVFATPLTGFGCLNEEEAILLGRPRLVIAKHSVDRFSKTEPPRMLKMLLDGTAAAWEYDEAVRPHLDKISPSKTKETTRTVDVSSHLQRIASGANKSSGGSLAYPNMSDGTTIISYLPGITTQQKLDDDIADFPNDADILRNADLRILSTTAVPSPDQMVFEFAKDSSDFIFKASGTLLSPVDSLRSEQLRAGIYGFRSVTPENRGIIKRAIASNLFRSINMQTEELLEMIALDEDSGSMFPDIDEKLASDLLALVRSGKSALDDIVLTRTEGMGAKWGFYRDSGDVPFLPPGTIRTKLSEFSYEQQKQIIGEIVVSSTIATWAHSSTSAGSRLIASRIRQRFNLRDSMVVDDGLRSIEPDKAGALLSRPLAADGLDYMAGAPALNRLVPYIDKFIEAVYKSTQNYFSSKGITHIPVWRGMGMSTDGISVPAPLNESIRAETALMRPLSSWSVNRNVAVSFAGITGPNEPDRVSRQLFAYVPVENIFSTPFTGIGALDEDEVVVIGKPIEALVYDSSRFMEDGSLIRTDGVGPFTTESVSDVSQMSYGKWLDEIATRRLASGSETQARKLNVPDVLPEDAKYSEEADYLLRLKTAVREYEETGSWMGEKHNVSYKFVRPSEAIDYTTGDVDIHGDFKPINVTKEQWEQEGREIVNSREKMMREKIDLMEVNVERLKFIAQSKRARMEQGIIDIEDISDDEFEELLAESNTIRELINQVRDASSPNNIREQAKQRLMQMFPGIGSGDEIAYFAHAGTQYLSGGITNPDLTRSAPTATGNTRSLNDMMVAKLRNRKQELEKEVSLYRSIISDIEKTGQIRFTKENVNLIRGLLIDSSNYQFPEWIDRPIDVEQGEDIFKIPDSVDASAVVELMNDRVKNGAIEKLESVDGLLETLSSSNDQFLSGISGWGMAETSVFNGYFGRYSFDDWPKELTYPVSVHDEESRRFTNPDYGDLWMSRRTSRGTVYLFAGRSGSEITTVLGPGDESQLAGQHAPLIGVSNGVQSESALMADRRALRIAPAIFARAIRAHREHGSVTPDIVLGRELMPTMKRLSSGRVSIRPASDRGVGIPSSSRIDNYNAQILSRWMGDWGDRELFPSDYSVSEETADAIEFLFDDWVSGSTDSDFYRRIFDKLLRDPAYAEVLKSRYTVPKLTGPGGKWAFLLAGALEIDVIDNEYNFARWKAKTSDDISIFALNELRLMQSSALAGVFTELTQNAPVTKIWRGMFVDNNDAIIAGETGSTVTIPISTATGRPGLAGEFARGIYSATQENIDKITNGEKIPVVMEMVGRNIPVAFKHDNRPRGLSGIDPVQKIFLTQSDERLVGGKYRIVSRSIDSTGRFGSDPMLVVKVEQVEQRGDEIIALTPVTERLSSGARSTFKNLELLRNAGKIKVSTREDNNRSRVLSTLSRRAKDMGGPYEINSGKFIRSGIAVFRNGSAMSIDSPIDDNNSRLEAAKRIASFIDLHGPNVFINKQNDRDVGLGITTSGNSMYMDVADIYSNTQETRRNASRLAFLQNQAFALNIDEMWSRSESGGLPGKTFIAADGSSATVIANESISSFSLAKERLSLNSQQTGSRAFSLIGQISNIRNSKINPNHPDSFARVRGILAGSDGGDDLWVVATSSENIVTYKNSDISTIKRSLGSDAKIEDVLATVINSNTKPVSRLRTVSFGDNEYEVVEASSSDDYRGFGLPSVAAKLHAETYGRNKLHIRRSDKDGRRLASGESSVEALESSYTNESSQLVSLRSPRRQSESPIDGLIDGFALGKFLKMEVDADIYELLNRPENDGITMDVLAKQIIAKNISETVAMRGKLNIGELKQRIRKEIQTRRNVFNSEEETGYISGVIAFLTQLPRHANERIFSVEDRIYPLDSIVRRARVMDEAWEFITEDLALMTLDEIMSDRAKQQLESSKLNNPQGTPSGISLSRFVELMSSSRTPDKTFDTLQKVSGLFDIDARGKYKDKIDTLHTLLTKNVSEMRASLEKAFSEEQISAGANYEYFIIEMPLEIQAQRVMGTLNNPQPTRKILVRKRPFEQFFTYVPDGAPLSYEKHNGVYVGQQGIIRNQSDGAFSAPEDLSGMGAVKIDSSNINDNSINELLKSYVLENMETAFVEDMVAGYRSDTPIPGSSGLSTQKAIGAIRELIITGSIDEDDKDEITSLIAGLVQRYEKFGGKFSIGAYDTMGQMLGQKVEINKAGSIEGQKQIQRALVAGIISQWAHTSNSSNPLSLTIQHVARKMFGLEKASGWTSDGGITGVGARDWNPSDPLKSDGLFENSNQMWMEDIIREVLSAQYLATQQYFKDKGIKTVRVWRGQGGIDNDTLRDGGIISAQGINRPLSSWASTPSVAASFADGREDGHVFMADVPVEDVFSIPLTGNGCLDEDEVVLLGRPRNIIAFPQGTVDSRGAMKEAGFVFGLNRFAQIPPQARRDLEQALPLMEFQLNKTDEVSARISMHVIGRVYEASGFAFTLRDDMANGKTQHAPSVAKFVQRSADDLINLLDDIRRKADIEQDDDSRIYYPTAENNSFLIRQLNKAMLALDESIEMINDDGSAELKESIERATEAVEDLIGRLKIDIEEDPDREYIDTDRAGLVDTGYTIPRAQTSGRLFSGSNQIAQRVTDPIAKRVLTYPLPSPISKLEPTDSYQESKSTGRPLSWILPESMDGGIADILSSFIDMFADDEGIQKLIDYSTRDDGSTGITPTELFATTADAWGGEIFKPGQTAVDVASIAMIRLVARINQIDPSISADEAQTLAEAALVTAVPSLTRAAYVRFVSNGDSDEAIKIINGQLSELIRNSSRGRNDVFVRVPGDALKKIASSRVIMSQFESRRSEGVFAPDSRARTELGLFGYHPEMPKQSRPIYGIVSFGGIKEEDFETGKQYGGYLVVLNREINDRTTFTQGDSLSLAAGTSSVNEPTAASLWLQGDRDASDLVLEETDSPIYFDAFNEAQIHPANPGERTLTADDIDYVVFDDYPYLNSEDQLPAYLKKEIKRLERDLGKPILRRSQLVFGSDGEPGSGGINREYIETRRREAGLDRLSSGVKDREKEINSKLVNDSTTTEERREIIQETLQTARAVLSARALQDRLKESRYSDVLSPLVRGPRPDSDIVDRDVKAAVARMIPTSQDELDIILDENPYSYNYRWGSDDERRMEQLIVLNDAKIDWEAQKKARKILEEQIEKYPVLRTMIRLFDAPPILVTHSGGNRNYTSPDGSSWQNASGYYSYALGVILVDRTSFLDDADRVGLDFFPPEPEYMMIHELGHAFHHMAKMTRESARESELRAIDQSRSFLTNYELSSLVAGAENSNDSTRSAVAGIRFGMKMMHPDDYQLAGLVSTYAQTNRPEYVAEAFHLVTRGYGEEPFREHVDYLSSAFGLDEEETIELIKTIEETRDFKLTSGIDYIRKLEPGTGQTRRLSSGMTSGEILEKAKTLGINWRESNVNDTPEFRQRVIDSRVQRIRKIAELGGFDALEIPGENRNLGRVEALIQEIIESGKYDVHTKQGRENLLLAIGSAVGPGTRPFSFKTHKSVDDLIAITVPGMNQGGTGEARGGHRAKFAIMKAIARASGDAETVEKIENFEQYLRELATKSDAEIEADIREAAIFFSKSLSAPLVQTRDARPAIAGIGGLTAHDVEGRRVHSIHAMSPLGDSTTISARRKTEAQWGIPFPGESAPEDMEITKMRPISGHSLPTRGLIDSRTRRLKQELGDDIVVEYDFPVGQEVFEQVGSSMDKYGSSHLVLKDSVIERTKISNADTNTAAGSIGNVVTNMDELSELSLMYGDEIGMLYAWKTGELGSAYVGPLNPSQLKQLEYLETVTLGTFQPEEVRAIVVGYHRRSDIPGMLNGNEQLRAAPGEAPEIYLSSSPYNLSLVIDGARRHDELLANGGPKLVFNVGDEQFAGAISVELFNPTMTRGWVRKNSGTDDNSPFFGIPEDVLIPQDEPETTPYEALLRGVIFARENPSADVGREIRGFWGEKRNGKEFSTDDIKVELERAVLSRKSRPQIRLSSGYSTIEDARESITRRSVPPQKIQIPDSMFNSDTDKEFALRRYPDMHMRWDDKTRTYRPSTGLLDDTASNSDKFFDESDIRGYLNRDYWHPSIVPANTELARVMNKWRSDFADSRAMARAMSGLSIPDSRRRTPGSNIIGITDESFNADVNILRNALSSAPELGFKSYRTGYLFSEIGASANVGDELTFAATSVAVKPSDAQAYAMDDISVNPDMPQKLMFEFPSDTTGLIFDEVGEIASGRPGAMGGERGNPVEAIVSGKFRVASIEKREFNHPYSGRKMSRDVVVLERMSSGDLNSDSTSKQTEIINIDGWRQTGRALGSQPGGKFQNPETGKEYYVKEPRSRLHAENESLVTRLYERLGVRSARVSVGERNGRPQIVSEWLVGSKIPRRDDAPWRRAIQESFVANAWLANWDATGNPANIIEGADGMPYIVDAGGGLLFRARGEAKGSKFGPVVGEMESLRDPWLNPAGSDYFKNIQPDEIARQVGLIGAISDDEIENLVMGSITDGKTARELTDTLIARRDYLVENWATGTRLSSGESDNRRARRERIGRLSSGGRTPEEQKEKTERIISDVRSAGGGVDKQWGGELTEEYYKKILPILQAGGIYTATPPSNMPAYPSSSNKTHSDIFKEQLKAIVQDLKQTISTPVDPSFYGAVEYPPDFIEYVQQTDSETLEKHFLEALLQMHGSVDKRVRVQMERRGMTPMFRDGYKTIHELGSRATADTTGTIRRAYEVILGIPDKAPASVRPVSGYVTFSDMNRRELEIKQQIMERMIAQLKLDINNLPDSLKGLFNPDNIDVQSYEHDDYGLNSSRRVGRSYVGGREVLWRGRTPGIGSYGSVEVVLRPEVSQRSAYTNGDSLNGRLPLVPIDSSDPVLIARALFEKDKTKIVKEILYGRFRNDYSSARYEGVTVDESGRAIAPQTSKSPFGDTYMEAMVLGAFDLSDIEEIRIPIYDVPLLWAGGWRAVETAQSVRPEDRTSPDENEDIVLPDTHYGFLREPGKLEELGFSGEGLEVARRIVEESMRGRIVKQTKQLRPEEGLLKLADAYDGIVDNEYAWVYSTLKRIAVFEMHEELAKRGVKLTVTTKTGIDLTIPKSATSFRHGGNTLERSTDEDTWRDAIRKRIINDLRFAVESAMQDKSSAGRLSSGDVKTSETISDSITKARDVIARETGGVGLSEFLNSERKQLANGKEPPTENETKATRALISAGRLVYEEVQKIRAELGRDVLDREMKRLDGLRKEKEKLNELIRDRHEQLAKLKKQLYDIRFSDVDLDSVIKSVIADGRSGTAYELTALAKDIDIPIERILSDLKKMWLAGQQGSAEYIDDDTARKRFATKVAKQLVKEMLERPESVLNNIIGNRWRNKEDFAKYYEQRYKEYLNRASIYYEITKFIKENESAEFKKLADETSDRISQLYQSSTWSENVAIELEIRKSETLIADGGITPEQNAEIIRNVLISAGRTLTEKPQQPISGTKNAVADVREQLQNIPDELWDSSRFPGLNIKIKTRGARGHWSPSRQEILQTQYTSGTSFAKELIIHELTHALEDMNPGIKQLEYIFHKLRAKDEKPQSLQKLQPGKGYAKNEVTIKDEWSDPYSGKIYRNGGRAENYEIMTMGMQELFKTGYIWQEDSSGYVSDGKHQRSKRPDDEHMYFVLGVLMFL